MNLIQQNITLNKTTSVLNECLNVYNSLEYLFHFLGLNPNYGVQDNIPASNTIIIDNYSEVNPLTYTTNSISTNTNANITIGINQSIFDISTRYYGDLSQIINILAENPQIGNINNGNLAGININITPNNNNNSVIFFNKNNKILATGLNPITQMIPTNRSFNASFNFSFH